MIDKLSLINKTELDESLALARHQAFMKDTAPHLLGGIFSSMFALYFFYDANSYLQQAIWFASYILIACIFAGIYFLYDKKNAIFTLNQWVLIGYGIIFVLCIFWAFAPFLFLTDSNSLKVVILILLILCNAIAPAAALIYYPLAYIMFASIPFLSIFCFVLSSNTDYDLYTHLLPLLCLSSVLAYGFKLKDNVFNTLNLQVENTLAWRSAEQANIAKSTFLAAASHDIRQPLQAISLLLEAFNEDQQPAKEQQLLQHLKYSVNSMSELLNSLLEVSRLDAQVIKVEPENIALRPLCEKLLQETEQQNQHKAIKFHLRCEDLTAYADPLILKRVINNLLNNALRYTEEGQIILLAKQQQQTISISVFDTGIGIKEDEKSIIFDEFYQSGYQNRQHKKGLGLGLGLSIVKRLCELHNWKVGFKSVPLQGTEFNIEIEAGNASHIEKDITLTTSVQLSHVSIVIIDDENSILQGLKSLLEKWGCNVHAYSDPDDAINDLSTGNISCPNLIISDYRLGNNRNGIEVIHAIREDSDASIEAILITGDTGIKQIVDAQNSGLTVLHKPIKPAQLRKVIQLKMRHLD